MSELEALESRLLSSPAARARFLADTLEALEGGGADTAGLLKTVDLTDGARFLGGLAAATIVITRTSTGLGSRDPGTVADTVVITRTSTGLGSKDPGTAADTLVITRTSTGLGAKDPNTAASTLVITRTSTGLGTKDPSTAASTVVITRTSTGLLKQLAQGFSQLGSLLQQEVGAIEETLQQESKSEGRVSE